MLNFNEELKQFILERLSEFDLIDEGRKSKLKELAAYISEKANKDENAKLIFICTHNSRRSHFAQVWMQAACYWYDITHVETYSGGTEVSACNERTIAALLRAGFLVENTEVGSSTNPKYRIKPGESFNNYHLYSKLYNDPHNPQTDFAAVMVCSHADENCPFIPGAERRFSIPYEDPKEFDGTEKESEMYLERCAQIAREMLYVGSLIKIT